jgi:hypothetical protein
VAAEGVVDDAAVLDCFVVVDVDGDVTAAPVVGVDGAEETLVVGLEPPVLVIGAVVELVIVIVAKVAFSGQSTGPIPETTAVSLTSCTTIWLPTLPVAVRVQFG